MPFVEIKNLAKRYSGDFALNNINFELEKGETITLLGPSGSGKTSLLRNICGLDIPDSGSILVDGRDVTFLPTVKRNIGMIFQDLALFPHMTVYDNIAYGLRSGRMGEKEVEDRVIYLAKMLRINELLEKYPGRISGGQRQRVALARSVAPSPSVLLLDEPMSSLDMQLRSNVRSDVKSFARKMDLTMVYVTHDHREGLYMGDKTGIMFDGSLDGISDPPEMFLNPKNEKIARFLGYNVVNIGDTKFAFYPSDFQIVGEDPEITGVVESIGFEGKYERAHLVLENEEVVQLEIDPYRMETGINIGDLLKLRLPNKKALLT